MMKVLIGIVIGMVARALLEKAITAGEVRYLGYADHRPPKGA